MSSVSTETSAYVRHAIHGEDRTWAETNCYTDLLIELVHSLGHDPVAMLNRAPEICDVLETAP